MHHLWFAVVFSGDGGGGTTVFGRGTGLRALQRYSVTVVTVENTEAKGLKKTFIFIK